MNQGQIHLRQIVPPPTITLLTHKPFQQTSNPALTCPDWHDLEIPALEDFVIHIRPKFLNNDELRNTPLRNRFHKCNIIAVHGPDMNLTVLKHLRSHRHWTYNLNSRIMANLADWLPQIFYLISISRRTVWRLTSPGKRDLFLGPNWDLSQCATSVY